MIAKLNAKTVEAHTAQRDALLAKQTTTLASKKAATRAVDAKNQAMYLASANGYVRDRANNLGENIWNLKTKAEMLQAVMLSSSRRYRPGLQGTIDDWVPQLWGYQDNFMGLPT